MEDLVINSILVGSIYRHYDKSFVKVVAKCVDDITGADMIVYLEVYNSKECNVDPNLFFTKDYKLWVTPASKWFDVIDRKGNTRYTLIK